MATPDSEVPTECSTYRIRFRGQISATWLASFDDATLTTSRTRHGILTTIICRAVDQAALMGIVSTIYDLGGELVSIESISQPTI
jgi:hypothetical protein